MLRNVYINSLLNIPSGEFLPDGKFNNVESKAKHINFAPVTNLPCEHNFGDLDSSQRRRPNATYHHHTSAAEAKS